VASEASTEARKVTGRKRCILVDTLGLLLAVSIFAADIPDADGAAVLLAAVAAGFPGIRQLWADGAFLGWFVAWCQQALQWVVTISSRPADQPGFVVLPRRWVAERSLAWLSRPRRLAKDYEELSECAEAQIYLASISLLLTRLAPPHH
jgi:putative transposase